VTTVDQHGDADRSRATIIHQGVQGCPDGSTGKQDIINQDHFPVVDGEGQIGRFDHRLGVQTGPVITVKVDIESADGHRQGMSFENSPLQTAGKMHSARLDADQYQFVTLLRAFHDAVSKRHQGFAHRLAMHYDLTASLPHCFSLSYKTGPSGKTKGAPSSRQPLTCSVVWCRDPQALVPSPDSPCDTPCPLLLEALEP